MARTREENREYMRKYRADKPIDATATVTQMHTEVTYSVVDAVAREIESLPLANKHHADVAAAFAMARILDNPDSIPQQASAALRLKVFMDDLREGVESGTSKLATLRAIRPSG